MSWLPELYIGEIRPWPDAVRVVRGDTEESRRYVPERTAKMLRIPRKDYLEIGHYECGFCHALVSLNEYYCHHCGARLVVDDG